jgi:phosphatidylinositol alpha-1,6-mannosyltransferase
MPSPGDAVADREAVRILLVAPLFPPRTGGVPTLYHHICRSLPPGAVVVLAGAVEGDAEFDRAQPYPIHRVPGFAEVDPASLPRIAAEAWRIHRLARRAGATHVVIGHVNQCLTGWLLLPFWGPRLVLYTHGEEIAHSFGGRMLEWAKRRFLRRVRRVVAVSRFTAGELEAWGVAPSAIRVIPNAVDVAGFRPEPPDTDLAARWGLTEKRVVLTLARLEARKGQDTVLRALPEIAGKVPDVHYLVCGTGEDLERLEALARDLGVAERVTFSGAVAEEALCKVYNLADVFVMPNRRLGNGVNEGFGIVFLEAGACGVPVVGGRAGGVPDAIRDGETGLLVDGERPDEVAAAVVRLLTDRALARAMGEKGRAFARSMSYERLVAALLEFLGSEG